MADPDFLANAKRTGLDILPMDGQTVARTVAELSTTPPAVVSRVRAILAAPAQ
jgi:hypothetical protein